METVSGSKELTYEDILKAKEKLDMSYQRPLNAKEIFFLTHFPTVSLADLDDYVVVSDPEVVWATELADTFNWFFVDENVDGFTAVMKDGW